MTNPIMTQAEIDNLKTKAYKLARHAEYLMVDAAGDRQCAQTHPKLSDNKRKTTCVTRARHTSRLLIYTLKPETYCRSI
jgi:hypothetical protein